MHIPDKITFFERFEADIVSGKKTITIRDESESHFVPGTVVQVSTFETGRVFCSIEIISVEPILFDELSEYHAQQENMTLPQLIRPERSISIYCSRSPDLKWICYKGIASRSCFDREPEQLIFKADMF